MKQEIIARLRHNQSVFISLLTGLNREQQQFREAGDKWNIHEILCHLYDEERDDFRYRTFHAIHTPNETLPPINPEGWVKERKYADWNFEETLKLFIEERNHSLDELTEAVNEPTNWESEVLHPHLGELSAEHFLHNWVAHDHIHIRQINRILYAYMVHISPGINFQYAGDF